MLIGTYTDGSDYVAVAVKPDIRGGAHVLEARTATPGTVRSVHVRASFATEAAALSYANSHLFTAGGQLGHSPAALACSPVPEQVAREMFSRSGVYRFLHVPAAARP